MAKLEPALPFDHFSGKLAKNERIVMRTRYGRTHSYAYRHPYDGPISENRKPIINAFAKAVAQCKIEMNDPERMDYWQKRFIQYTRAAKRNPARANAQFIGASAANNAAAARKNDKLYVSLRGFIIASLSVQLRDNQ